MTAHLDELAREPAKEWSQSNEGALSRTGLQDIDTKSRRSGAMIPVRYRT